MEKLAPSGDDMTTWSSYIQRDAIKDWNTQDLLALSLHVEYLKLRAVLEAEILSQGEVARSYLLDLEGKIGLADERGQVAKFLRAQLESDPMERGKVLLGLATGPKGQMRDKALALLRKDPALFPAVRSRYEFLVKQGRPQEALPFLLELTQEGTAPEVSKSALQIMAWEVTNRPRGPYGPGERAKIAEAFLKADSLTVEENFFLMNETMLNGQGDRLVDAAFTRGMKMMNKDKNMAQREVNNFFAALERYMGPEGMASPESKRRMLMKASGAVGNSVKNGMKMGIGTNMTETVARFEQAHRPQMELALVEEVQAIIAMPTSDPEARLKRTRALLDFAETWNLGHAEGPARNHLMHLENLGGGIFSNRLRDHLGMPRLAGVESPKAAGRASCHFTKSLAEARESLEMMNRQMRMMRR